MPSVEHGSRRRDLYAAFTPKKRLSERFMHNLLGWVHPGFSVFAGDIIPTEDQQGLERVARCISRPALAIDSIRRREDRTVSRSNAPDPRTGATVRIFDPLEWIHAVTAHVPDRGQHQVPVPTKNSDQEGSGVVSPSYRRREKLGIRTRHDFVPWRAFSRRAFSINWHSGHTVGSEPCERSRARFPVSGRFFRIDGEGRRPLGARRQCQVREGILGVGLVRLYSVRGECGFCDSKRNRSVVFCGARFR